MGSRRDRQSIFVIVCAILLISALSASVWAQGLPQSPYSAPSVVRGGGLDLAPSNPLRLPSAMGPRGSDSILLTPQLVQGILPLIPYLQVEYLYSFGKSVGAGRLKLDYLLPVRLGSDSAVFGEAHGEFQNFWKTILRTFTSGGTTTTLSGFNERTGLSFGGGYRTILNENTFLGVNGFFDTTKLGSRWYSSGGFGFEMAALLPGNDAADLNFNWYGNLFSSNALVNVFRQGPQNYDLQAGYSHELWNGGPDLRLGVTGYSFSAGSGVYGVRAGAELKTRDGRFSVKYEAGNDKVNQTYHTVGGSVNVGLQIENLLSGQSPFTAPEPVFGSPRNWKRRALTAPVKRLYHPLLALLAGRLVSGGTQRAPFIVSGVQGIPISGGGELDVFLPSELTDAVLNGATRIGITWTGTPSPIDAIANAGSFMILRGTGGGYAAANLWESADGNLANGAVLTNPAAWTGNRPYNRLRLAQAGAVDWDLGTITLIIYYD